MFSRNQSKPNLLNKSQNDVPKDELFELIENKNKEKLIKFINNPDYKVWQIKDENKNTILHRACFLNDKDLIILIIQELKKILGSLSLLSKFINEKTDEGMTALHYAAYKGNLEISKILIENGASVDAITKLGKNIIHLASEGNQPSIMIYFLYKEGLDIFTRDENGSSPLHWACYSGAEESVNFLLSLKADINSQDKEKLTPLHLATLYNREKIVIKLLQNGANKYNKNTRGELPIDIARKKYFYNLIDILEEKDYYKLCTLEPPLEFIKPNNIYEKFLIIMLVIPELIIIFIILPYLEKVENIILNNILFLLDLLLLLILLFQDPGYKNNSNIVIDKNENYPLMNLIEQNVDIRDYCPKCFISSSYNYKHCIICDKCIEGFSHHCFWLNKCIGKKNKIFYLLYILFSLIFAFHSIFICLYSLLDFIQKPYEKLIYFSIFENGKGREIRVLFSGLVGVFSFVTTFPLSFLLLIEFCKYYKNKRKNDGTKENNKIIDDEVNLDIKNKLIDSNINNEYKNIGENNDVLGINRETNLIYNNNEKEIMLSESNIQMPQTPFSVE